MCEWLAQNSLPVSADSVPLSFEGSKCGEVALDVCHAMDLIFTVTDLLFSQALRVSTQCLPYLWLDLSGVQLSFHDAIGFSQQAQSAGQFG